MSGAKHTPGPWLWDVPDNWHQLAARIYHMNGGKCDPIAQVQYAGWPAKTREANARLIAAAPDLLAALTRVLSMGQPECQFVDEARAAIAAATGGAS